ncbi:MAG TPA: NUDIX hydrolase [Cyanothece sp. UBA12306]|nr:NUDIX hydrolase [Cyanothece sp. UBA12306]
MNFSSPTKATLNSSTLRVALAIIYQEDRFLMQLRDDLPHIAFPGHWGLFGGHLESGETPEEGFKRELIEEINYQVPNPVLFRIQQEPEIIRYFYHSPLTVPLEQLELQEGMDLGLVPLDAIEQGKYYSQKIQQVRPLGSVHRTILLDFFESYLQ